ncbi:MAG: peptide chain release factor N(5)-glutamine methyltransferase [Clostridia bacterium]|nr:peptide chain release factor N(5)-glutamine methyltransferase [Clostridia bacterium]
MILRELNTWAKDKLKELDSPAFDVSYLIEEFIDDNRNALYLHGDNEVPEDKETSFRAAVEKRKTFYPLQYILGWWYFRDMKLKVKDGVLCPRDDTEVLVMESLRRIKEIYGNKEVKGLDLCSGTGCVPLGITQNNNKVTMDAVELFPVPLECLRENLDTYGEGRVTAVEGDIFSDVLLSKYAELDFITSNPPYISSEEMPTLQAEVRFEPREALTDEGDGLKFYRHIISKWKNAVKIGGFIALEIGENQTEDICRLLTENGFTDIRVAKDLGNLDRAITAVRVN